ncbi:hypothetical protein IHE45_18G014000 [Dioscorea alata]|uniref:Uncharacterized protein n=1 Tax=Dioscorea alata TaxID=55571 RepID=A0ACB7U5B6_DIOAL|nr:hypothetical protein IHE45_18G014000 [Dioscorea alata]
MMTSFMLTSLVEQANLRLKSDKCFKNVALNAVARVVSARFNLAVSDTHVNNRLRHKKIVMGEEEYQIYIQVHPGEEIYINKPIQDYDEMAIVCGSDQATGSFARTGSQSSRSLGARMDQPPTSPVIDLDNQTQGFDDFDDFAPSDNPTNDTPTTATSMARKAYDYLLQNLPLANGFMNKTHSLRCIWMDDFLDRLRDDRRA